MLVFPLIYQYQYLAISNGFFETRETRVEREKSPKPKPAAGPHLPPLRYGSGHGCPEPVKRDEAEGKLDVAARLPMPDEPA